MGRSQGYIHIYYCCESFLYMLLYHNFMVGGWIASWVSLLYYVLLYCCITAVLLLYRVVGG